MASVYVIKLLVAAVVAGAVAVAAVSSCHCVRRGDAGCGLV